MIVHVQLITSETELEQALDIRRVVFVHEQNVPVEEEIDEYEPVCRHFLARTADGIPCGAGRWRFAAEGAKLERFAVLRSFRKKGVGSALVKAVLSDIEHHPEYNGQKIYLHAQLDAIPLYEKFGFQKTGPLFYECDIRHYKMIRK